MKLLKEFKEDPLIEEEKSDFSRFDTLVRAGLADKTQIQRLHKILNKMQEERPQFNSSERVLLQNLFTRMVDLITNNKQIFQKTRQVVREEEELDESMLAVSDFKINAAGKKYKAHRVKVGDVGREVDDTEEIKEAISQGEPPFVLVLKRKAYRLYPNNLRVALYYNDKLDKYFSVPYISDGKDKTGNVVQAESRKTVIETLDEIIIENKSKSVKFSTGETKVVDRYMAEAIIDVFVELNEDNRSKMADMLEESPEQFMKVATFAYNKQK
jgi:hypothetical protein